MTRFLPLVAALAACAPKRPAQVPLTPREEVAAAIDGMRAKAEQVDPSAADVVVVYSGEVTGVGSVRLRESGTIAIVVNLDDVLAYRERYGIEAVWGLMAHQFGNALDPTDSGDNDVWAGCLLRSRGMPLGPYMPLLRAEVSDGPGRVAAVRRGWHACVQGVDGSPVVRVTVPELPAEEPGWI